jgi:hypothetical protein
MTDLDPQESESLKAKQWVKEHVGKPEDEVIAAAVQGWGTTAVSFAGPQIWARAQAWAALAAREEPSGDELTYSEMEDERDRLARELYEAIEREIDLERRLAAHEEDPTMIGGNGPNDGTVDIPIEEDTERPDSRQVVIDFLDAWRFCPVASSPNPSRQCLENAADQLLDALAVPDTERPDEARNALLDARRCTRMHSGSPATDDALRNVKQEQEHER